LLGCARTDGQENQNANKQTKKQCAQWAPSERNAKPNSIN
jgi:hypothetical protein